MKNEKVILFYTLIGEMTLSMLACFTVDGWEPAACFLGSTALMVFLLWANIKTASYTIDVEARITKLEELQRRGTLGRLA